MEAGNYSASSIAGAYLESIEEIPEPHEFGARLAIACAGVEEFHELTFEEHDHGYGEPDAKTHRDNNFRAALVHVIADAAVSILVTAGLIRGRLGPSRCRSRTAGFERYIAPDAAQSGHS